MTSVFPSFSALENALSGLLSDTPLVSSKKETEAPIDDALVRTLQSLLIVSKQQPETATKQQIDLTISKGKDDEEEGVTDCTSDDDEVDDVVVDVVVEEAERVENNKEEEQKMSLPPPPSSLCDCHGTAVCPGYGSGFSYFCCGICMGDFTPGPIRPYHSPNCHTVVCDDCLTDQLSFKIRRGEVTHVNCPSCQYHLLPSEVSRRVLPEDLEKYHRFLLRKLLDKSRTLECGNPGCENAIFVDLEHAGCEVDWKCEVCEEVCAFCKGPAHNGSSCAAYRKFKRDEARQSLWVAFSLSKRCPSCRTPIIKKGGCPHMNCANCHHQWCWHCKGDWDKHGLCPFAKVGLVGLAIISPAVVALMASALLVVVTPALAMGGQVGNVFDRKSQVHRLLKKCIRIVREL